MTEHRQRFTGRVAEYAQFRPRYPAEVIPWLTQITGLNPTWQVADIGAGTGMLTELFLDLGCQVWAVEPNPEMRTTCRQLEPTYPNLQVLDGTAEATQLPASTFDLIAAGRAFHWFDPDPTAAEFRRILKPAGWVALVSAGRAEDDTPQAREYEQILVEHGTDYAHVRDRYRRQDRIDKFFAGGELHHAEFLSEQTMTLSEFTGTTQSYSCTPLPGSDKYQGMQDALASFFDRWSKHGLLRLPSTCFVNAGRLSPG